MQVDWEAWKVDVIQTGSVGVGRDDLQAVNKMQSTQRCSLALACSEEALLIPTLLTTYSYQMTINDHTRFKLFVLDSNGECLLAAEGFWW